MFAEYVQHVAAGLEPFLASVDHATGLVVVRELHGIRKLLACRDAQKHVVRVVVLGIDEMYVVCRNHANVKFFGERKYAARDQPLARENVRIHLWMRLAVVFHDLKRIVVAEQFLVPFSRPSGLVHLPRYDGAGDLAGKAGRRAVQALVVAREQIAVDARPSIILPVYVSLRDQLHEIVVPDRR